MNDKVLKIVLFGPESTGKSVLSEQLARHFNTTWVPEYARTYLESKKKYYDFYSNGSEDICLQEDILPIVLGQIALEDLQAQLANELVFFDTNPLQTKVYVNYYYESEYNWLSKILEERHYDLYLLMDVDIEWQPDPLRDRPEKRNELFDLFKRELDSRGLPYRVISGKENKRFENAISDIKVFIEKINSVRK